MFSSADITTIQRLLTNEAKNSPTILGAKIGDIVKKEFPHESIRAHFGTVKNFVDKNLSDIMKLSGRQGVDNVYSFKPELCNELDSVVNHPSVNIDTSSKKSSVKSKDLISAVDPEQNLRIAIKASIDLMTSEQIRQLAIPAGILHDAIIKTTSR